MRTLLIGASGDEYGADVVLMHVARHLADSGHRVALRLPNRGPGHLRAQRMGVDTAAMPMPVLRRADLNPFGLFRLAISLFAFLPRALLLLARFRPDVVYVNTLTNPAWILLARLFGRRVVCHVHEIVESGRLSSALLVAPLAYSHGIITVSHACSESLTRIRPSLSSRLLALINPPFDVSEPIALDGGELDVVMIGRIGPRKGQRLLLEALREFTPGPSIRVHVCGDIYPTAENRLYLSDLRGLAETLPLEVTFHGFIDKISAYRLGGIVVVPSTEPDPCPLVVIEAMAAGRVVLAAAIGGIPEQLGDAGLQFEAGSATALSRRLESVFLDAPLRSRLREASLKRAEELSTERYFRALDGLVLR